MARSTLPAALMATLTQAAPGELRLAALLSDRLVLQRDTALAVRDCHAVASQPIPFNKSWLPAAAFRSDTWPIP